MSTEEAVLTSEDHRIIDLASMLVSDLVLLTLKCWTVLSKLSISTPSEIDEHCDELDKLTDDVSDSFCALRELSESPVFERINLSLAYLTDYVIETAHSLVRMGTSNVVAIA